VEKAFNGLIMEAQLNDRLNNSAIFDQAWRLRTNKPPTYGTNYRSCSIGAYLFVGWVFCPASSVSLLSLLYTTKLFECFFNPSKTTGSRCSPL